MPKKIREIFSRRNVHNYLLIALGCFLLAFGDAVFISPFGLIPGGVISVGVIIQHFVTLSGSTFQVIDIVTWGLQLVLLVVSFLFLGKKFTLHTLFATLIYPLFFTLLYRVPIAKGLPIGQYLASLIVEPANGDYQNISILILSALFGGAFIGAGVGFTFSADGSTGGFDVLCVLSAKHGLTKESTASFSIDASLVLIGIICTKQLAFGLLGILAALVCAVAIQFVYDKHSSYVIAEIISDEYEKIVNYVIEKMDRSTTIIDGIGAYSKENKKVLRVCFSKRQLLDFRDFIAQADPKAFITFTDASMINGEGFDPLKARRKKKKGSQEKEAGDGK